MVNRWPDDESLLADLQQALHPEVEVPASVLNAAYGCYAWHQVDAELAALAYDSATDDAALVELRSESATLRALTFEAPNMTFELEVMPDGLAGQLIPPPAGELQLVLSGGEIVTITANAYGYFRIRPAPTSPFRLRCRLSNGRMVSTGEITL